MMMKQNVYLNNDVRKIFYRGCSYGIHCQYEHSCILIKLDGINFCFIDKVKCPRGQSLVKMCYQILSVCPFTDGKKKIIE